jgi:hypothetical protein
MSDHDEDQILFARRRPALAHRRSHRRSPHSSVCRVPLPQNMPRQYPTLPQSPEGPPLVDLAGRPKDWHCIACGWRCDEPGNDYLCARCGAVRPFAGGGATMLQCRSCKEWSLALAHFCEWCGTHIW